MSSDKVLETVKVTAGKRTYYFEIKLTNEGAKYLKIIESIRLEDGSNEQQGVEFFEKNINDIAYALQVALRHFPTIKPDGKSKMEQTKEKFENAYKPWVEEEDWKLTKLYGEGKKPQELTNVFKRNLGAINSRIEKLNLKQRYSS